jgi:transposase
LHVSPIISGDFPVFHHTQERINGHLFITLLAYHLVHTLRYQLKQQGIHLSWESIRNIMSTQQRITLTLPTDDHKTMHILKHHEHQLLSIVNAHYYPS